MTKNARQKITAQCLKDNHLENCGFYRPKEVIVYVRQHNRPNNNLDQQLKMNMFEIKYT